MTITTASAAIASTPPRSKPHRIPPHEGPKAQYTNKEHEHNADQKEIKTNKRNHQVANKKRQQETSNKRPNSNHTPRRGTKPAKDDSSSSCASSTGQRPKHQHVEFIDPTDPQQAHRIKQRQKMIAKGKNTSGYARYRSLVPLNERKARSLDTPSTPNPYQEMSTKRWQGLVRAWRIALHKFDPPELVQTLQPPPLLLPHDTEQERSKSGDEKDATNASDSVFMDCQTPSKCKGDATISTPSADRIVIRDAERADDDVSPCVSVVSRTSPIRNLYDSGARRDLDSFFVGTSGIEKLNRYDEEEILFFSAEDSHTSQLDTSLDLEDTCEPVDQSKHVVPVEKQCNPQTVRKCWGDESSDEEDDDLL